jgi:hypothetical protein
MDWRSADHRLTEGKEGNEVANADWHADLRPVIVGASILRLAPGLRRPTVSLLSLMQLKVRIAPLGAAGVACIRGVASLSAAVYDLGPTQDARILGLKGFQAASFRDDILSVYIADANVQRTLLQFDLGQVVLAPGERLAAATLTLYASLQHGGTGGKPAELYAVARPWTEDGLTWLQASTGFPWTTAGGDFVGADGLPDRAPFAVSTTEAPAQRGPVTWEVRELVDLCLEAGRANQVLTLTLSYCERPLRRGSP